MHRKHVASRESRVRAVLQEAAFVPHLGHSEQGLQRSDNGRALVHALEGSNRFRQ